MRAILLAAAAASLLGAVSSALDGQYARAAILGAVAAGSAVAGRKRPYWLTGRAS